MARKLSKLLVRNASTERRVMVIPHRLTVWTKSIGLDLARGGIRHFKGIGPDLICVAGFELEISVFYSLCLVFVPQCKVVLLGLIRQSDDEPLVVTLALQGDKLTRQCRTTGTFRDAVHTFKRITGCTRMQGVIAFNTLHDESVKDRKSTRLNSSHQIISYAVFCL